MNVVLPNIANCVSEILSRQQFINESERSRETLNLCNNVDHHRDQRSLFYIKFDDLVEDLPQDSENQYQNTGLQVVSTLSCDLGNVMKIDRRIDDFSSDDDPSSILHNYRMLRTFCKANLTVNCLCKPIAVDKATQDMSRPSTVRVKSTLIY
ncbi:hypothetical protein H5410_055821 [Solanum commersonii]|uniref:Uncharacterized protein n=1 Tax=Solanum commersonii TaxID=4109 RepID=A0A9J5WK97_SOLCO|nr:hypothetical protein H5410_055821 [Solanum commersonii]